MDKKTYKYLTNENLSLVEPETKYGAPSEESLTTIVSGPDPWFNEDLIKTAMGVYRVYSHKQNEEIELIPSINTNKFYLLGYTQTKFYKRNLSKYLLSFSQTSNPLKAFRLIKTTLREAKAHIENEIETGNVVDINYTRDSFLIATSFLYNYGLRLFSYYDKILIMPFIDILNDGSIYFHWDQKKC